MEQMWMYRQPELNGSAKSRGGGGQAWSNWWDSVIANDECIFTVDTPVDRNTVFS